MNRKIPGLLAAGTMVGPAVQAQVTTQTAWTVRTTSAPEIDPASAASGLTLLLGALAVLRSRHTLRVRLG
jgi:hypothetical protein